jgi:hypothetical protein
VETQLVVQLAIELRATEESTGAAEGVHRRKTVFTTVHTESTEVI